MTMRLTYCNDVKQNTWVRLPLPLFDNAPNLSLTQLKLVLGLGVMHKLYGEHHHPTLRSLHSYLTRHGFQSSYDYFRQQVSPLMDMGIVQRRGYHNRGYKYGLVLRPRNVVKIRGHSLRLLLEAPKSGLSVHAIRSWLVIQRQRFIPTSLGYLARAVGSDRRTISKAISELDFLSLIVCLNQRWYTSSTFPDHRGVLRGFSKVPQWLFRHLDRTRARVRTHTRVTTRTINEGLGREAPSAHDVQVPPEIKRLETRTLLVCPDGTAAENQRPTAAEKASPSFVSSSLPSVAQSDGLSPDKKKSGLPGSESVVPPDPSGAGNDLWAHEKDYRKIRQSMVRDCLDMNRDIILDYYSNNHDPLDFLSACSWTRQMGEKKARLLLHQAGLQPEIARQCILGAMLNAASSKPTYNRPFGFVLKWLRGKSNIARAVEQIDWEGSPDIDNNPMYEIEREKVTEWESRRKGVHADICGGLVQDGKRMVRLERKHKVSTTSLRSLVHLIADKCKTKISKSGWAYTAIFSWLRANTSLSISGDSFFALVDDFLGCDVNGVNNFVSEHDLAKCGLTFAELGMA
jgi:hypothetical protein